MKNLFNLKDKVIIVTGGASGNGLAISKAYLDNGARVVIVDNDNGSLKLAKKKFHKQSVEIIKANVNNQKERAIVLKRVTKKFKFIDCLVNNAGISISDNSLNYKPKNWDKTINTNLSSIFFLSQLVIKYMIKCKIRGSIINITSLASSFGMPNNPAYVASKGGLKYLSKAMAVDVGKHGIRVNNICPGYIRTNMTNKSYKNVSLRSARASKTILNKWGETSDLIGAAIYLASDASSYVTGTDLIVDGGWTAKGL